MQCRFSFQFLVWLLFPALIMAQTGDLRFGQVSLEAGLSQSVVNCIYQDKAGFLWFGTQDGLNRYDGRNFAVFRNRQGDPESLANNYILSISEDKSGRLVLATFGSGVAIYDPNNSTFKNYTANANDPLSGPIDDVLICLLVDSQNRVWTGGYRSALSRLDFDSNRFKHYLPTPEGGAGFKGARCRVIFEDRKGRIWVGTDVGLNLYDPDLDQFQLVQQFQYEGEPFLVRDIVQGVGDELWVGTWGAGLYRYNPETGETKVWRQEAAGGLSHNKVRAIVRDGQGLIWAGTLKGLNRLDPDSGRLTRFMHQPGRPNSLGNDHVTAVFEDRSGVLWLGVAGEGLNRLNRSGRVFQSFTPDPVGGNGLSAPIVFSVYKDRGGVIWVGTYNSGLDRLDPNTGLWRNFSNASVKPNRLMSNQVNAIFEDRAGRFYLGTNAGGLYEMDREQESFQRFDIDFGPTVSADVVEIMGVTETPDGRLWVSTVQSGLIGFDLERDAFTIHKKAESPDSLSSDDVLSLLPDENNGLWLGLREAGLNYFINDGVTVRLGTPQLSNDTVNSLIRGDDGAVYAGTDSGLNRVIVQGETVGVERFGVAEGLDNDVVYGLLKDELGNLWMSTNGGLFCFNPDTGDFSNYTTDHGLLSNEFNQGAYGAGPDGELLFGGLKGVNMFYPRQVQPNLYKPPLALTAFRRFNREVNLGHDTHLLRQISLSHEDDMVSFEFAALDFNGPERNQYAYKLEGFNNEWIDMGHKNEATFTNLDPGDYRLLLKGSNNEGVWNEAGISLNLEVIPPWWQTLWAKTLFILALIGSVIAVPLLRIRNLQKREEELSGLVREATTNLRVKNDELKESNTRLTATNRELELLDQVVRAINREFKLEPLLETILDEVMAICPGADRAGFMLRDRSTDGFQLIAAKGYDPKELSHEALTEAEVVDRYMTRARDLGENIHVVQTFENSVVAAKLGPQQQAASLLAIAMEVENQLVGFLVLDNMHDPDSFNSSDVERLRRLRDHTISALAKARVLQELTETSDNLKQTQAELMEAAHLAGMAEIATGILHNVGNALNSVNTSAELIEQSLNGNKVIEVFDRVVQMFESHRDNLGEYLSHDERGKLLPDAMVRLNGRLQHFNGYLQKEIQNLKIHVSEIRDVVSYQEQHTHTKEIYEQLAVQTLLADVLKLSDGALAEHGIILNESFADGLPVIHLLRSKLTHVLINLINNAVEALRGVDEADRELSLTTRLSERDGFVEILIQDTGVGIPPENLSELFKHGFSTKHEGHGFGLHYCANTLHEMGGLIHAASDGVGKGALFTVIIPVSPAHI